MKTTPLTTLTACIAILGIALSANAATTFQQVTDDGSGYDIFNTDNWTNGLPTLANVGTINLDSRWDVNSDHMTGWHLILQTGGSMYSNGLFNDNKINGATILDLQGGTYSHTGAQQINDGATVLCSGATSVQFQWTVPLYGGGVTFDVSAGTVSLRGFQPSGSTLNTVNISGGSLTTSNQAALKLNGNIEFNVSGGTFTNWMGAQATATDTTYNVSGGDIVTADYEANGKATIDFTTGSTGTFTLTGADQAAYEALYTAGSLLYNGSNTATFGDVFSVSEGTISVVPEPATMSLLALGGIAMLKRRKK